MLSYFYKLAPLFIIGTIFILSLPWLGLIALMVVALVVLPAIAFVIVWVPYRIGRAISRGWNGHSEGNPQPAAVVSEAARHSAFRKEHAA